MRGMMSLHGVDPRHYLDYVHDIDYSPILPNPDLERSLALGKVHENKASMDEIEGSSRRRTTHEIVHDHRRTRGSQVRDVKVGRHHQTVRPYPVDQRVRDARSPGTDLPTPPSRT